MSETPTPEVPATDPRDAEIARLKTANKALLDERLVLLGHIDNLEEGLNEINGAVVASHRSVLAARTVAARLQRPKK